MSKELDELLALSCADLKTNGDSGSQVLVLETHRRSSTVKQMTATELAAARAAAAAAELEFAFENERKAQIERETQAENEKIAQIENEAMAAASLKLKAATNLKRTPSKSPRKVRLQEPAITNIHEATNNENLNHGDNDDYDDELLCKSKSKLLPTLHAPRERIISLPNILDEGMENEFLAISGNAKLNENASLALKPQLEQHSAESLYNKSEETQEIATLTLAIETEDDEELVNSSKSSIEDYETIQSTSIADSIELLRMQRCERERGGVRNERERERSFSPNVALRLRHDHERSAAPDRLHSSSISSITSACSISASASVNASKNVSRRGSGASNAGELIAASSQLPPTPPPTAPITPSTPLNFPISKTSSQPNLQQRRKSSLSALFPGASPLVAPEPLIHSDPKAIELLKTIDESNKNDNRNKEREIPTGKFIHRTKTPPPVGVKLGVNLKRVSPPKTHITVKKNEAPMLGVVLRKVEKKVVPQKSILDDDKPLYHFSIVRSDNKEYKPSDQKPKPKPTTATLQKSATTTALTAKPNSGGIFSGPQVVRTVKGQQPIAYKPQKPQPGVPITIQKIEGDKVIIIKKIFVPKNSKIPEQYKVGARSC